MSLVDDMIRAKLNEENAPVTAKQMAMYARQVDAAFNFMQQQIISLDVTCGLLLEKSGMEPEEFRAQVASRVNAVAEAMKKQREEQEKGSDA